jgi:hypothetical protein
MLEGRAHDKGFVDISEEEMKPLRRYMVNGIFSPDEFHNLHDAKHRQSWRGMLRLSKYIREAAQEAVARKLTK